METLSEFDDEIEFGYFLGGEGEVKGLVVAVDVVSGNVYLFGFWLNDNQLIIVINTGKLHTIIS